MPVGPKPETYKRNPNDPGFRLAVDASSADVEFWQPTVAIHVGVAGNIEIVDKSNATVLMTNLAAGVQHRIVASKILTGTTSAASELVAVW